MQYALVDGQRVELLSGQPFEIGEIQYPGNVIDLWSAEALAAIGVLPIAEPDPAPAGEVELSRALTLQNGAPAWTATYGPQPLPAEVPMHKILKAALITPWPGHDNLDAAIRAAFASLPYPQDVLALAEYERAPNFVTAGVTTQNTKAALGMTDEQFRDLVLTADAMA